MKANSPEWFSVVRKYNLCTANLRRLGLWPVPNFRPARWKRRHSYWNNQSMRWASRMNGASD